MCAARIPWKPMSVISQRVQAERRERLVTLRHKPRHHHSQVRVVAFKAVACEIRRSRCSARPNIAHKVF